ncbi:circumsporozoite protein-like [Ananas comosus]|uniref:Circumsporozoite protein-like n=1 Tax=Ananas comosus TaxID=4615 RepID=A0A6P5GWD7_ANACO|nr:circumsporozoite protein-like [Ananas comosus]
MSSTSPRILPFDHVLDFSQKQKQKQKRGEGDASSLTTTVRVGRSRHAMRGIVRSIRSLGDAAPAAAEAGDEVAAPERPPQPWVGAGEEMLVFGKEKKARTPAVSIPQPGGSRARRRRRGGSRGERGRGGADEAAASAAAGATAKLCRGDGAPEPSSAAELGGRRGTHGAGARGGLRASGLSGGAGEVGVGRARGRPVHANASLSVAVAAEETHVDPAASRGRSLSRLAGFFIIL